jgi:hypothetical protein
VSEHKISLRQVVRVNQSPMNPLRWCIELSCRHEVWVTRKSKPKVKVMSCAECATEQREKR